MTCATCGEEFASERAFDRHRTGRFEDGHMSGKGRRRHYVVDSPNTRRCLSVVEMQARGMARNSRGKWSTSERLVGAA